MSMMEIVSARDRERLRSLAHKQLEYANSPENDRILKQWRALAEGRRESPTVRLLFSNFTKEVITNRMVCEGEEAKRLEYALLSRMVGRELFGDDTPIQPTHDVQWDTWVSPFGIKPQITRTTDSRSGGFHIDPVITDLEAQLDDLRGGSFRNRNVSPGKPYGGGTSCGRRRISCVIRSSSDNRRGTDICLPDVSEEGRS